MQLKWFNLLSFLVIFSLMAAAPATATAQAPGSFSVKNRLTIEPVPSSIDLKNTLYTPDGKARVIVQLAGAPLALAPRAASLPSASGAPAERVRLDANSPDSQNYLAQVSIAQADFVAQLNTIAPDAQVSYTYQVAFNGLAISIDPNKVNALANLPEVLKIYPDQIREVQMDASLPLINAPTLWTALGGRSKAGAGIKIANIDSGLRPANPMFSAAGFITPPGYPKGFCAANPSDTTFQCNSKLIVARVFPDAFLPVAPEENIHNPIDIDGHGTHTAGTAAGNEVTLTAGATVPLDTTISGVAPAAYLMVYKALFEKPDHSGAYGSDFSLIAALNAALMDGADVINNSWGGGPGGDPNANVEKPVIDAITAAGTLVVFAAGNDGHASASIGCPGCVENALTVAASTTGRVFANRLEITGPGSVAANLTNFLAVQGSGPKLSANLSLPLKYSSANSEGCAAFPAGIFANSAALIQRGTCTFAVKIANAKNAGASSVVMINNTNGAPTPMSGLETSTIPALMISQEDGALVTAWISAHPTDTTITLYQAINRVTNLAWQDIVAGFSSAGPNGDPAVLKPDIAAPGVNILSAVSPALSGGSDPVFTFLQGTSMAAPHISGASALLMQLHPTWTPAQVKTVLTSTSVQTLKKPDGATAADPFDMGAGRVDLARALNAGLAFDKPSLANGNCVITCSWTRSITNIGATTATWNASVSAPAGLQITISPDHFTNLAPGLTGQFTVTVNTTALPSGIYKFGAITWSTTSPYTNAYLPLAVKAGSASSTSLTNSVSHARNFDKNFQTYTLKITNPYLASGTFFVSNPLPANAAYVPGSASGGLVYDGPTNTLNGSAYLSAQVANIVPDDRPTRFVAHTPDPVNDFILSNYCTSPCDDTSFNITGVDYWYMGVHYDTIGVNSNGYLMPGGATSSSAANQLLPNPATPNNVIAPLWSDLVMKGAAAGDAHTGIWLVWGTPTYTIYEWQNAQHFDNDADQYTFQVWFEDGTSNITIVYGKLSALNTHNFTVGMENASGTVGATYYYVSSGASQGTPPAVGTDLMVNNNLTSQTMTFVVKVNWTLPSQTYIMDIASLKNNLNIEEAVATARTDLLATANTTYFPVIKR